MANKEHIRFPDLPDSDKDKKYLDKIKDDMIRGNGAGYVKENKCQKRVEEARSEAKRETRNQLIRDLYAHYDDLTQQDIADFDGVDVTRPAVHKILNNG